MKKESSEQQQRVLRKLVRYHKPTPAMSAPVARKSTPVVPVGKRTTRSEAAKIRAEGDLHGKVLPTIKLDSKHSEDTSSSESTDSQSEQQKQNSNVPSTKINENQSETNPQQEIIEEKCPKKPRKKRISRALFRHDTIDYIKPKKQELLQKTFSLGFKKLVSKSKEIYTKNDDLPNSEETEFTDSNKDTVIIEESNIQVSCPMKSPQNLSTSNEEKQINTIIQSKSIQQILDMPSLDSPNSQQSELCTTQISSLNKMNLENTNIRQENKKVSSKRKEKQKPLEENVLPKNENSTDKLSTTTVPRNIGHIQTNSSQKLHYPFYGLIPNKKNTVTSEELNNQPTVEDQIPKYKITIVNNPSRVKTNRIPQNLQSNPHQYLIPREVQYKIPPHPKTKQQLENQMQQMPHLPYSYYHPNYGHPYMYPYLQPGYPQNYLPQQTHVWNPHINQVNQQNMPRTDRQKINNLPQKEALLNQEKQQINTLLHHDKRLRFSPETLTMHQENMPQRNANQEGVLNQEKRQRFLPETTVIRQENTPTHPESLKQRNKNIQIQENILICHNNLRRNNPTQNSLSSLSNQEKRVKFSPETLPMHQENLPQRNASQEVLLNQEKRQRFLPESTLIQNSHSPNQRFSPESLQQRITAQEVRISPKEFAIFQENLRQINTNLTSKDGARFSPENSTSRQQRNIAVENTQSKQENAINSKKINNLNHVIPVIHQQNTRHTNQNLNEAKINQQIHLSRENLIKQKQTYENATGPQIINYPKAQSLSFIQYQNSNHESNINTTTQKLNADNSQQSGENSVQGQKRSSSPIKHKINHKRVHFDSNLTDKINLLHPINYAKPDIDGVPIINVTKMPNTPSQKGKYLYGAPETKESVIVSPNNRRSIPETPEHRVIVLQANDNLHSDHNNLHNQNKNNLLFMQDKNHTPAEFNNKIIQTTCSVIKKVCTEQKNQHTIENILSNKCSTQNKTNNEVNNNNKSDKIKILNIETLTLNDSPFTKGNTNSRTVIQNPKIKSFECETILNNPTPSRILTRRKTLQHIDLTDDTDQEKNTNSLNLQQQLLCRSDRISLNDTQTLVASPNRLTNTQSEYLNTKTGKNTQEMAPIKGTEQKSVVQERPMPKLIQVPEEFINKQSKHETSDERNERTEKSSDNSSRVNNVNNYASKNVVPFLKPAHSNNINKIVETNLLPLNLSLKNDDQNGTQTNDHDKESDQNKRQSIIVNNKSGSHEPLDLTNLSFVKSEEEYKGYLKLLKEKNATGPYLFYKFVTSVRKRNNQPIFDLMTFFSLLKQGKLVEYKNMYTQCNSN